MDALVDLIHAIDAARQRGADDAALAAARTEQGRAQFLLDFAEAENSTGFHADQEAARILAKSIDYSRKGLGTIPK
jgi:nitrite reductase (cytochrome c-552)